MKSIVFRRILFLSSIESSSNEYKIEWDYHYKDIKGIPIIKFQPNFIEINIKVYFLFFFFKEKFFRKYLFRKQMQLE